VLAKKSSSRRFLPFILLAQLSSVPVQFEAGQELGIGGVVAQRRQPQAVGFSGRSKLSPFDAKLLLGGLLLLQTDVSVLGETGFFSKCAAMRLNVERRDVVGREHQQSRKQGSIKGKGHERFPSPAL